MQVSKWGNSVALRIPKPLAEQSGLREGTRVRMRVAGGSLIVNAERKPLARGKFTLKQLVAAITPENRHREIDWGKPAGIEVW
ncbi:MAG: AbrB/MazE/SpoVT family DNA-binding domain-containing protein [Candidatus Binataceae bacterium]